MQVSVENTSDLGRRVTVELPGEDLARKIDERLQALQGQVAVDGFRPGKVPLDVVQSKYGDQIRKEVCSEAVNESLPRALQEAQLEPVGEPEISIDESADESVLRYFATFEIMPEIKVKPVDSVRLTRLLVEINDADVDTVIEKLRRQRVKWSAVDRPAQVGDRVTLDYRGTVGGQVLPGGEAHGLQAVIGEGALLPGFEERLTGMQAGASVDIQLTLPDTFADARFHGKAADFHVELKVVEEAMLPELDQRFFRSFGVAEGDLSVFRDKVRESMEFELRQKIVGMMKKEMLDQLLEMHEVEVPETLIQLEIERQRTAGTDEGEDLAARARYRVSCGIILTALAHKLGISATPEQVRKKIEELAQAYENPDEVVAWYYSSSEQMASVEAMVNEEMLLEHVLEHGQVTERTMPFAEAMDA